MCDRFHQRLDWYSTMRQLRIRWERACFGSAALPRLAAKKRLSVIGKSSAMAAGAALWS